MTTSAIHNTIKEAVVFIDSFEFDTDRFMTEDPTYFAIIGRLPAEVRETMTQLWYATKEYAFCLAYGEDDDERMDVAEAKLNATTFMIASYLA